MKTIRNLTSEIARSVPYLGFVYRWTAAIFFLGLLSNTAMGQGAVEFDRPAFRNSMLKKTEGELQNLYNAQLNLWREALAMISESSDKYRNEPASNYGFWQDQYIRGTQQGELARQKLFEIVIRQTELKKKISDDDKNFLITNIRMHIGNAENHTAFRATEALIAAGVKSSDVLVMNVYACRGTNQFQKAMKRLAQLQATGFRPSRKGARDFRNLTAMMPILDSAKKKEQRLIEKDAKANLPVVEIETNRGTITVELFEDDAPNTVANFLVLAKEGFYNGLKFYRSTPSKLVTGSPNNKKDGNSGFKIPLEGGTRGPRALLHGYLVMEIPEAGEISSQFAIRLTPLPKSSDGLTAFGRVIKGTEVLDHIKRIRPKSDIVPDKIIKIKIINKRNHAYEPKGMRIL